jgi:hypothetical protein
MKQQSRIPVVVLLTLMLAANLLAQSPLITNPTNLSQFPSVEKIRIATKGTDDVDTHARFMAALWRINDMIKEDLVKAPNGGYYDMPDAAQTVQRRYSNAITRYSIDEPSPAARDARFRPLEQTYEKDPAFLDGLLTQLFSPKFRTDYYAWIRKPVPAQTAVTAAAGNISSSPDPSIAKAKAAQVDLTLFAGSITLGNQFSFPNCPPIEINVLGIPSMEVATACDATDRKLAAPLPGLEDLLNSLGGGGKTVERDPNLRDIELPASSIPRWVASSTVVVRLDQGGRIVAVIFLTKGLTVQKSASDDLMAKYGKAHYSEGGTFKTDGGREFKYEDRYWTLPGIHVEYDALMADEDNRSSVDGYGRVRVETETEYSRRKAEENKPKKRVL